MRRETRDGRKKERRLTNDLGSQPPIDDSSSHPPDLDQLQRLPELSLVLDRVEGVPEQRGVVFSEEVVAVSEKEDLVGEGLVRFGVDG